MGRGCDSRELFSKFEISESPDFEKYRNQYNTISLNMQEFFGRSDSVEVLVDRVKKLVLRDLKKEYPDVDYFDGLKDDVLSMIAEESIPVNTGSFTNDMTTFRTEDDVLTLLIHLGYLAYDSENKTVKIPNNEVRTRWKRICRSCLCAAKEVPG